jgi:hypothetical protein
MIIRRRRTRGSWPRYTRTVMVTPLLLTAVTMGCSKDQGGPLRELRAPVEQPATAAIRYPALAGTWEYEESGNTILITLNEYGNGSYQWKDGRFLTVTYANGVWKGFWSQRENDRDGAFEVTLSEDRAEGKGRWWYTRIGSDTAPTQAGGVFQMARRSSSDLSELQASDRWIGPDRTRPVRSRDGE